MRKYVDQAPSGEAAVIDAIVAEIIKRQQKSFDGSGKARRFLHGKSLGVVETVLEVRELPEEFRIGVFAEPKSYRSVVRFSNGGLPKAADIVPNVRGMALKIYDVPGNKLLPGEERSDENDFVMANDPTFFIKKIEHFIHLIQGKIGDLVGASPDTIPRTVMATNKFVKNLLEIDYFTQVPSRFGDTPCKYALRKTKGYSAKTIPNILERDYLRHSLEKELRRGSVKMEFCVQLQKPGDSISDSSKAWVGEYIPLADLIFPQITSEIKESDGEDLAFNPYRVIAEHEPLSWPGRLRRAVYAADANWRHEMNKLQMNKASHAPVE